LSSFRRYFKDYW